MRRERKGEEKGDREEVGRKRREKGGRRRKRERWER